MTLSRNGFSPQSEAEVPLASSFPPRISFVGPGKKRPAALLCSLLGVMESPHSRRHMEREEREALRSRCCRRRRGFSRTLMKGSRRGRETLSVPTLLRRRPELAPLWMKWILRGILVTCRNWRLVNFIALPLCSLMWRRLSVQKGENFHFSPSFFE